MLVRPMKYNVGDEVLLRNSGNKVLGYGSAFATDWIGPYRIHAIFDKGAYKISTIPKDGRRVGVLKNPVNWSRLRRFVLQGDDKFFNPEVNALDDLEQVLFIGEDQLGLLQLARAFDHALGFIQGSTTAAG